MAVFADTGAALLVIVNGMRLKIIVAPGTLAGISFIFAMGALCILHLVFIIMPCALLLGYILYLFATVRGGLLSLGFITLQGEKRARRLFYFQIPDVKHPLAPGQGREKDHLAARGKGKVYFVGNNAFGHYLYVGEQGSALPG